MIRLQGIATSEIIPKGSISGVSIVDSTIAGGVNVGAIAGTNNGTISLCANYVGISGTNVGGIAGVNNGNIEKSFNAGTLSGSSNGGIAYQNNKTIKNSFNMADFSGSGIAKTNSDTIENCYNAGLVSVGITEAGNVTNSYYLEGMSNSGLGTAKTIDSFTGFDSENNLANLLNNNEECFIIDHTYAVRFENDEENYQFPHIINNYINITHSHAMKVTLDGQYHIIEDINCFKAIGSSYNNLIPYYTSSKYILHNSHKSLDFSGQEIIIPEFSGELNGNNFTLSNLNKTVSGNNSSAGLFNNLNKFAKISNLILKNFNITNEEDSNNSNTACGLLAGRVGNGVKIENVYAYNSNAYSYGSTGGLIGECMDLESQNYSGGYIRSCGVYNCQSINLVESTAIIYNSNPTGGFIAKLYDSSNITISNCFAVNENISGGRDNVLARGINRVGGFVAVCDEGAKVTIQNCFSYGSIRSESKTIAVGNKDSFGGFIGINSSGDVKIHCCYAFVQLDYDTGWLDDYIDARSFGHNAGVGSFENNYALSQDTGNNSGANNDLSSNEFNNKDSFANFNFDKNWSMGNVENIINIPVPNQGGITILTDENSTIKISKDNNIISNSNNASIVNLSGLAYGTYNVEISSYGQTSPTTFEINLSYSNKSSYISNKKFFTGNGTESSPYTITNQKQFENLENSSAFFVLKNNINAFNSQIASNTTFSGNFNGDGKKIYNFTISSSSNNVGLFETLTNATINNLYISSFFINSQNALNTGALAGTIENSQVENIYIEFGIIEGGFSGNIGGLAGEIASAEISNVESNININSTSQNGFTGGLVGVATNGSNISLSFSSGEITGLNNIGGFIGNADSVNIQNSYTLSMVSSETNDASTSKIGGFAGNISTNSSISTSFMYGSVKSLNNMGNVGVFAGVNNSSNLQNNYAWNVNNYNIVFIGNIDGVKFLTTDEFASQSEFVGFDFTNIWTLEDLTYPVLIK